MIQEEQLLGPFQGASMVQQSATLSRGALLVAVILAFSITIVVGRPGGHGHSPHGHSPHSHSPHSHSPHSHSPHSHSPHTHSPPPPSPPPDPPPPLPPSPPPQFNGHQHNPHTHSPHTHNPHSHSPHSHSPRPSPPPSQPPPGSPSPPPPLDAAPYRFVFADGIDGLWSTSRTYADVQCAAQGYVYLHWTASHHDLWRMASATHLAACDFSGATQLVGVGDAHASTGTAVYYLPCTTPGDTIHLSCSVGGHCQAGQRLSVSVHATARVFDETGELLIHSRSLSRV